MIPRIKARKAKTREEADPYTKWFNIIKKYTVYSKFSPKKLKIDLITIKTILFFEQ